MRLVVPTSRAASAVGVPRVPPGCHLPVTDSQVLAGSGSVPYTWTLTDWESAAQQVKMIRVRNQPPPYPAGVTKPVSRTVRPLIEGELVGESFDEHRGCRHAGGRRPHRSLPAVGLLRTPFVQSRPRQGEQQQQHPGDDQQQAQPVLDVAQVEVGEAHAAPERKTASAHFGLVIAQQIALPGRTDGRPCVAVRPCSR